MRPNAPTPWIVIGLLAACDRTPDVVPRAVAVLQRRAPADVAPSAADADTDEQRVPDGYCHPATVIATATGGAVIDACFDPQVNATDLLAQALDADGMAVGRRARLRRVAGNVLSLSATPLGDGARVAWIAHVGEGAERNDESADRGGGTRDLSVLSLDASFAPVGAPIAVNRSAASVRGNGRGWSRSRVEVAAGPEGSLVVLATDAEEVCPQGTMRCATWSVFSVAADGTSRRLRHDSTGTPSLEPQGLVRAGDDLVYLYGTDAVRNVLHPSLLRAPGAGVASLPAAMFDALTDWTTGALAWSEGALVALGEEHSPEAAQPRGVVRVTSPSRRSPTRPRPGDDPEVVRWPLVTERTWRCVGHHPVLRVAWRGGSIELDPTVAGTSMDLSRWVPRSLSGLAGRENRPTWNPPMAWVGRALVALDGHDQLHRWTCSREGAPPQE